MNQTSEIVIEKFGPASSMARRQRPSDRVGDDDVAIAVKYSGINFADIHMRLGYYPDAPKRPFVPGYEVSGTVEAVGKNVTRFAVGDPVVAGTYFGGYASRVTIPEAQVLPLPAEVDLAEGAALPVAFFTAHLALFEMARVRAGDRVLIECATGGVGTVAVQMARAAGAQVTGLTSSPSKKGYIEELGAAAYTRDELHADASLTGYDLILNASGGAEIRRQLPRLGLTGRMVCIGMGSGTHDGRRNLARILWAVARTPRVSILKLFEPNIGVFGLNALTVLRDESWSRRLTEKVSSSGALSVKPRVGKVFPAADVGAAHEYLATRQAVGKVLLEW
jgi:NADPH2:quinone reductase